jgi:low temperature requirement protein LtrA
MLARSRRFARPGLGRNVGRCHGEVMYSRKVGVLELFYDLVYVVLIGRAADHLARQANWHGVRDFAVVFG